MSGEIIEVSLDNPSDVMKFVRDGLLESGPNIFKDKWKLPVSKGTPRTNEIIFVLIQRENVNLIIVGLRGGG